MNRFIGILIFILAITNLSFGYVRNETINNKIDVYSQYILQGKTFANLITYLNNNLDKKHDLLFTQVVTLAANASIPTNAVTLEFEREGVITGNYIITYNGNHLSAGRRRIHGYSTIATGNIKGSFYPEWNGAVVGDSLDDSVAINSAGLFCDISKSILDFGPGTYNIKSTVFLYDCDYAGSDKKTIFEIDASDFTFTGSDPQSISYLINVDWSRTNYNASTANSPKIHHIKFYTTNSTTTENFTILLSNTDGVRVYSNDFVLTGTKSTTGVLFDAHNINFKAYDNTLTNTTGDTAGGAIWVRNFSSNPTTAANLTKNGEVYSNIITDWQTGDEAISFFGSRGPLQNIKAHHNTVIYADGQIIPKVALLTGSLGTTSTHADAYIKDSYFDDNYFEADILSAFALNVGVTGSGNITDVGYRRNTVRIKNVASASGTSLAYANLTIPQGDIIYDNIVFEGNNLIYEGTVTPCVSAINSIENNAIYNIDILAEGNYITGNITSAIRNIRSAKNNRIHDVQGYAITNVQNVVDNEIKNSDDGVLIQRSIQYDVSRNDIELSTDASGNGIFIQQISSSQPTVNARENRWAGGAGTDFFFRIGTASCNVYLSDNFNKGVTGNFVNNNYDTDTIVQFHNNKMNNEGDTYMNSNYAYATPNITSAFDFNEQRSCPVGHIVFDTSLNASPNVGWIKILPGQGITKWREF